MSAASGDPEDHGTRLAIVESRLTAVESSIGLFRRESDDMQKLLKETKGQVDRIEASTGEIVRFFGEAKEAFRLFNRLAWLARKVMRFVVLPVALVFAALYAWAHHGEAPPWIAAILSVIE